MFVPLVFLILEETICDQRNPIIPTGHKDVNILHFRTEYFLEKELVLIKQDFKSEFLKMSSYCNLKFLRLYFHIIEIGSPNEFKLLHFSFSMLDIFSSRTNELVGV